MLTSKQIRSILAVAEAGSISKASELLHIAQPALSRQIKFVEEDLGVPLFDRGVKGVTLTTAGAQLVERGAEILDQIEELFHETRALSGEISGTFTFAMPPSTTDDFSATILDRLMCEFPHLLPRLTVGPSATVVRLLLENRIDIAVHYEVANNNSLRMHRLWNEPLLLVAPPEHGLSLEKPVKMEEYANEPFVLSGVGNALRKVLQDCYNRMGKKPTIAAEVDDVKVLKDLVLRKKVLAVQPMSVVYREIERGDLCAARIVSPDLSANIVTSMSVNRPSSVVASAFSRILAEELLKRKKNGALLGEPYSRI